MASANIGSNGKGKPVKKNRADPRSKSKRGRMNLMSLMEENHQPRP